MPDVKVALRTRVTYQLFLIILFGPIFGFTAGNYLKQYGSDMGLDDAFMTMANSIADVFNASSRIVFGYLMDKVDFKKLMYITLITQLGNNFLWVTFGNVK